MNYEDAINKVRELIIDNGNANYNGIYNADIIRKIYLFIGTEGRSLLQNKYFVNVCKKNLYELYFNECIIEAIEWYKLIFNNYINREKIHKQFKKNKKYYIFMKKLN